MLLRATAACGARLSTIGGRHRSQGRARVGGGLTEAAAGRDGVAVTGVGMVCSVCEVQRAYSTGRVEIDFASRPANIQPMIMAKAGITITMRIRLSQGT